VITVSRNAKKELVKHANINPYKVHTIHLGVNKTPLPRPIKTKNNYFLYVANSAPHHNHIYLLDAFIILLKKTLLITICS